MSVVRRARRGLMRSIAAGAVLVGIACGSHEQATGVVVRQVLRGDAAEDVAPGPQAANTRASEAPQAVGTTLVFDQPQAFYRQALEQARRTFDSDNVRRQLNLLADTID